jgi:hypothetical protein
MKGMVLDAIHDDLVCTLGKVRKVRKVGKDAMAYSTVTKYARSTQFSGRKEITPPETPDVECRPVDESILTTLAEFPFPFLFPFLFPFPFPFSSVHEFSRRICLSRSTVHQHQHRHQHLTQSFASRCDIFDESLSFDSGTKQIRVQMAIELLQVLSVQSRRQ